MPIPQPLNLKKLRVYPLSERKSMSRITDILVDPDAPPPACNEWITARVKLCAEKILAARKKNASVMFLYGAHLVKNGASALVERLMSRGWITHLGTNGAGSIHDWEFAFQNWSTESVEQNVATGTFGTWDETGRNLHLALLCGGIRGEGYGTSVGRFIQEDGVALPGPADLEKELRAEPGHPLSPARAELLVAMREDSLAAGRIEVKHPWKHTSIFGNAFRHQIPITVHPGIGYDIISNHPMFNGAAIGRAATIDFGLFGAAVEKLDDGVVLSVGSAIMAPQVFEKSISCVNNLRLQEGRPIVRGHEIFVVDLQDGGNWDWTKGEPPKENPAYYLRFCKSFSRMGGAMHYLQVDNVAFVHNLLHCLVRIG
ncbi:MAG TPA: hypothetical protein VMZ27_03660 [Candidatus Saccharimonadales bacterium]|nr:hypothetical protein [Candidatus Saccharimonadales bacterium]